MLFIALLNLVLFSPESFGLCEALDFQLLLDFSGEFQRLMFLYHPVFLLVI